MPQPDLALIAHLMRRAGFGATRSELEEYALKDYEEVVEDLLHPDRFPEIEDDVLRRYIPNYTSLDDAAFPLWASRWIYMMINTSRPLEEKMALFWHHVFATGWGKGEHTQSIVTQIEGFRQWGPDMAANTFTGPASTRSAPLLKAAIAFVLIRAIQCNPIPHHA